MSSDSASSQAEAPSSPQQHSELYIGKYDYSAVNTDQLSFKEGDVMTILSKGGEWWYAELQSTGERGRVPSNFVVEKNSLEAEK